MLQTRNLKMNSFSFSLKQAKGEKVKKNQTRLRTNLWPTMDCRESLKTPKKDDKKDSKIFPKPFQTKHKKSLKI
jgi:hypothetical protein